MTEAPLAPELVITAPEPHAAALAYATRCRGTLGVLSQLFAEARNRVIFASPFVQPEMLLGKGPLAMALHSALGRNVLVDFLIRPELLERAEFMAFARMNAPRMRLFDPAFPNFQATALGSHAKFCIRDGEAAYVGSANLTGPDSENTSKWACLYMARLPVRCVSFGTSLFVTDSLCNYLHKSLP
jgi:hypothetical protein